MKLTLSFLMWRLGVGELKSISEVQGSSCTLCEQCTGIFELQIDLSEEQRSVTMHFSKIQKNIWK